eukprot:354060-Chlamydomonas_euryale.AAC.7
MHPDDKSRQERLPATVHDTTSCCEYFQQPINQYNGTQPRCLKQRCVVDEHARGRQSVPVRCKKPDQCAHAPQQIPSYPGSSTEHHRQSQFLRGEVPASWARRNTPRAWRLPRRRDTFSHRRARLMASSTSSGKRRSASHSPKRSHCVWVTTRARCRLLAGSGGVARHAASSLAKRPRFRDATPSRSASPSCGKLGRPGPVEGPCADADNVWPLEGAYADPLPTAMGTARSSPAVGAAAP